ncbi:7050_t:CDS:1 [Funneliformis mosseae]|uniref:7050_t:CDS:1 n=1 Tax=Funneliformis mosseae TaxID=27381 RepID=A0A9N8Z5T2_FUNMO|nr:7050_t:CDS:1 [Funneliformis mosseae]
MPCDLPVDCLKEIFEYLKDKDLHLYLQVNQLWYATSVRILWRKIQNFNTLLICLPNNSKTILSENGDIISDLTSKPSLFYYTTFIKSLQIDDICNSIKRSNKLHLPINNLESFEKYQQTMVIIIQEISYMLMNQTSLKHLDFYTGINNRNILFINYPEGEDCLRDFSELKCYSNTSPEFCINYLEFVTIYDL